MLRAIMRFDEARLRRVRTARGLSRAKLAARCPTVSEAALRSYEEGRHKPDIDRALELASALGVSVEKLSTPTFPEGATHARTDRAAAGVAGD